MIGRRRPGTVVPAVPAGFDEDAYLAANPDVADAVAGGAFASGAAHYADFGRIEGRALRPEESRASIILGSIDTSKPGLEIGPCHSPIAPRSDGHAVETVDFLDTAALRAHYEPQRSLGVPVDRIEDVDHVWRGEPLAQLVGSPGSRHWVIASHVIEHIADPIAFLTGVAEVLAPDGVLSLAVPDKRYCFDHYAPLSFTGHLLDAHEQHRVTPTIGQAFEYFARCSQSDGRIAWGPGVEGDITFKHSLAQGAEAIDAVRGGDDLGGELHLWRFTPESFELLIAELGTLGVIDLRIVAATPTRGSEFFVTLGHGRTVVDEDERLELLRAAVESDRTP